MTLPKGRPAEPIRAPRGAALSCKGWPQEAALRMLMNNLDPDVAERWEDLVVYGGSGKAARSWEAYHSIVATLRRLEGDATLLVQSGKPVGVFTTSSEDRKSTRLNSSHQIISYAVFCLKKKKKKHKITIKS